MYSKNRQIPLEISRWIEKDVKITKSTASSGLMPNNTRQNTLLSRQFYSNMLNLSSERYRKINRCDINKNKFLKSQQLKAETTMPGLLPYIEQITHDINRNTPSSINDQLISSSFQSFSSRSFGKPESVLSQRQISSKKNLTLESISTKSFNQRQKSFDRINRLAQPKGYHRNLINTDHVRSNIVQPITVEQLFNNINDITNNNSSLSNKPKSATNDKRFHRLIHIFSEIHERESSDLQTVKSIIESNSSLQNYKSKWQIMNNSKYIENHQQIHTDQFSNTPDISLVDINSFIHKTLSYKRISIIKQQCRIYHKILQNNSKSLYARAFEDIEIGTVTEIITVVKSMK